MNHDRFSKLLVAPEFWLLTVGAGLISIHLTLVAKSGHEQLFSTSLLYWVAVASLIWQRRFSLNFEGKFAGISMGATVISGVLFRSHVTAGDADFFLNLSPLLSGLGLGLIASGFSGLKQYWQELTVLGLIIPHPGLLSKVYDLSYLTAKTSTALLLYLGFDVSRQGAVIVLPQGYIGVNPGCSGYSGIMQILGISVIFLFMFPLPRIQQLLVPVVAVSIAFITNSIRVAILALLAVEANKDGFLYWHEQQGSLIFSLISVALLGLFCFFLIRQNEAIEEPEAEL